MYRHALIVAGSMSYLFWNGRCTVEGVQKVNYLDAEIKCLKHLARGVDRNKHNLLWKKDGL